MAEIFEDKLCVRGDEIIGKIVSLNNYRNFLRRGKINVLRRGCYETPALIEFESLPRKYMDAYITQYGDPRQESKYDFFLEYVKEDYAATFFFNNHRLEDGRLLPDDKAKIYTNNASVLNAVHHISNDTRALRKALQGSGKGIWESLAKIVFELKDKLGHDLPQNHRRLQQKLQLYKHGGVNNYTVLISDRFMKANRVKIKDAKQEATLRQLMRRANNFDAEQIKYMYNIVAEQIGWDTITAQTVNNYKKKWNIATVGGSRGEIYFDNNVTMQVKRKAPGLPLVYWTADGWDVELLYQKTDLDKNGNNVTTYHNRLTAVVILDPCGNYPVGYAIGTHETPALIREAYRDAVNHTQELFGRKHRVRQLQTDNYSKKNLTPFYEQIADIHTPARVHNAKAKRIEPYFKELNKNYCQFQPNWSGFGATARKESQPNTQYLNKVRHSFPDRDGCILQIKNMIRAERAKKADEYMRAYANLPQEDKLFLSDMEYFYLLCETKEKTSQLSPAGFIFRLNNEKYTYDCFDYRFRENRHIDWVVKYDPQNMENVLVHNGDGSLRFMLSQTYEQPMALYDRTEGDSIQLEKVRNYNKALKQNVINSMTEDSELVSELFNENPALQETLSKFVICDSNGQHKNQKSSARLSAGELHEKQEKSENLKFEKSWSDRQSDYLNKKVDITKYIEV